MPYPALPEAFTAQGNRQCVTLCDQLSSLTCNKIRQPIGKLLNSSSREEIVPDRVLPNCTDPQETPVGIEGEEYAQAPFYERARQNAYPATFKETSGTQLQLMSQ